MSFAKRYFDLIRDLLDRLEPDQIRRAAEIVAASLEVGGIVHVFGTGHSSLLAQEPFYRAGGLVAVNPLLDPRLGFELGAVESTEFERRPEPAGELAERAGFPKGDAGIVISNSGRNALPVEMALRMKAAGMKVIGLTNLHLSRAAPPRHASGRRLFEVVDAVLDNHGPREDASVVVPGIDRLLGPLSTIAGAALLHAVFLEAAAALAARGKPRAVFASANVGEMTVKELRRLIEPYRNRIRPYQPGGGATKPSG